ncbi:autotransporter-associated beta strand repeat-containing protein [Luteolibacter sp. LG18]|uniref:autotransporter-associated beta strand repeat-containing protein n=1 Tax=Luteolibacter sp. LG18 TaxID=2819286 RepID=UPI002B2ACDF1|nr:hypothetical protein llg_26100 [Luteolibacter sp. LG18]
MKLNRSNGYLRLFLQNLLTAQAVIVTFLGAAAHGASRWWDGGTANIAATGNGASGGTAGNWDTTLTNWDQGNTLAHVAWNNAANDDAFFAGTAGAVALTAPVTAGNLTFSTAGYSITGTSPNILTLGGTTATITTSSLAASGTTTISAPVAGTLTGGLTIASNGDMSATGGGSGGLGVRFGGTNTFTGDITVTSGLLSYTSDAGLGNAANAIILNGGGLLESVNAGPTLNRNVTVGAAGGLFRTWGSTTTTLNGVLSGSGAFARTDGGTVIFAGNNTYSGTFTANNTTSSVFTGTNAAATYVVSGGSIAVGNNGTTGSLNSASTLSLANGTTLFVRRTDAVSATGILPGTITLAGATSRFEYAPTASTATLNFDQDLGTDATKGYFRIAGGALSLASGTDVVMDTVSLGLQSATNQGVLNLLSGSTITSRYFNIGEQANNSGTINQADGSTVTLLSGNIGFRLGHWTNGTNPGNVYNLTGGVLDATALSANTGNDRFVNVGWDGQASMTVGGGSNLAILQAAGIQIDANGDSTFNDSLTVSPNGLVVVGALGVAGGSVNDPLVLNGGTVQASADGTWSVTATANAATTSILNPAGFNLTWAGNLLGTGTVDLGSSGTLLLNTTGSQTIAAPLSGWTPIRKTGTGNTILSGNTTAHGGTMALEGGRTTVTGNVSSVTNVKTGAVLGGEGSFTGDLTFEAGSKLSVDSTTGGALTVGNVIITGQPGIAFDSVPTQAQSPVLLFKHTGVIVGNVATDLILPGLRSPLINDDGTNVTLSFTTKGLVWNGTSGGQWDAGTSLRWNAAEADAFFWGDNVTFDDTGVNPAITLTGELQPTSVTVNANTNAYAFTGTGFIAGTGGLTKSGTGTLTLGTANTYTGATTVNAGTLKLANVTSLGATTAGTTINAGGTLDINGQDLGASAEAITISGTGAGGNGALVNTSTTRGAINSLTLAADATITNNNALLIGANGTGTTGTLALGSNTLTKNGTGDLVLNGINLTSGNITVNAGRLMLVRGYTEANQQAVTLGGSGTLTINSGGKLATQRWAPALTVTMPIVLNGGTITSDWPGPNSATFASNITLNTSGTVSFGGGYGNGTLSGVISGNGVLNANSDTLILTGANTYTGGTNLQGGILAFNSGSLATTGAISMNGGTLRWNGTNTQDLSSRLTLLAGKSAKFDTNGNNVTFAYSIGNSTTANLAKSGNGILTLAPVNTYASGTAINGGTVSVSAIADTGNSSIGTATGGANYVGIANGSTFQYTGTANATTVKYLWIDTGAGGTVDVTRQGANLTWTPAGGNRTVPVTKAGLGTWTMNGAISGTATVTVNAGTLALGAANTYTGATTVNAGGTLLQKSTLTSDITVATGGTLGGEGSSTNAITLNEGSTLLADFSTPAAQLTTTGAVTVNKTTSGVTLQLQNAPTTAGAQIVPILKYGTHSGGTTNFNTAAYRSATVTDDTTNKILSLNYTSEAKVWNGATGNTTWDLGVSTDWTGGDTKFFNGDAVSFTDAATSKAVTVTGTLTPAQVTFSNTGANAYTLTGTGVIAGTGSLAKSGTGTVTFAQTTGHTFSGGTTVTGGTIAIGNGTVGNEAVTALGTGTVTISTGGKVGFYPGSTGNVYNIPNNLVLNGGNLHQEDGHQHFLGTVSVAADSTVTGRWNPKSIWFDGVVSGTSKITVADGGNGAWVAFTNPFNSFSGTVVLAHAGSTVLAKDNTTLQFATVDSGGNASTFQVAATNAVPNVIIAGLKGTNAGAKVINADATARVLTVNSTVDGTYAGLIGDGTANGNLLSLVKSGSAVLTLGGASTYTGTTAVNAGTLIMNAANASSATTVAAGATLKGSGSFTGSVSVAATATLAPGNNAVGTLTAGSATLAGTYACEISGATADKLAVTGALTVSPGTTLAITTLAAPTVSSLTIATYTGAVPAAFTTVTGLPSGYSLDYSVAGQINLVQAGFTGWVSGFGLSGLDALVGADPDHDGIPNGVEFVIGGNPATVNDLSKMPTLGLVNTDPDGAGPAPTGDYMKFTFRRTAASVTASVTSGCEFDADLTGTWTTAVGASGVVQIVTADGFGAGVDKVEVFVPKATWEVAGKLFGRLRVSVP